MGPAAVDRVAHRDDDAEVGDQGDDVAQAVGVEAGGVARGGFAADLRREVDAEAFAALPLAAFEVLLRAAEVVEVPTEVVADVLMVVHALADGVEEVDLLGVRQQHLGVGFELAVDPARAGALWAGEEEVRQQRDVEVGRGLDEPERVDRRLREVHGGAHSSRNSAQRVPESAATTAS